MAWFGVRSIYIFLQKADGTNVFEERIVCIEAESPNAALDKGIRESEQYAKANDLEVFPKREAYEQDGDKLIDGYEVWSALFESRKSLTEVFAERYTAYDYQPE